MWCPEAKGQGERPEPEDSTCDEASEIAEPLLGPVGWYIEELYSSLSWAATSLSLLVSTPVQGTACLAEANAAGEEEAAAAAAASSLVPTACGLGTSSASGIAEAGFAPRCRLPATISTQADVGLPDPVRNVTSSSDAPVGQVATSSGGALSHSDAWQRNHSDAWQRFWEAAFAVWTAQLEQLQELTPAVSFPASGPLMQARLPLITVTTMGTVYFCFAGVYMHVIGLPLASVLVTDPGQIPASWKSQGDVHELKLRVERCTTERKRKDRLELRFCRKENTYKPDRAHYCKEARRNVLRMDGWMPWFRKCVGFYNHKFFILFLLYSCIASNLAWTHLGGALMAKSFSGTQAFMLFDGCVLSFFVAALTTPFLGFQCFLLGVNSTTVEFWEKRWDGASWLPSPYDRGLLMNVSSVMGHPALWLIPCGTPPTAGTEFVVAEPSGSKPRRVEAFVKIQEVAEVSHKGGAPELVRVAQGLGTSLAGSEWAGTLRPRSSRELPSTAGEQASFIAPVGAGLAAIVGRPLAADGAGAQKRPTSVDFLAFTGPAADSKGPSKFPKLPSREASFITYRSPSSVAKPPGQARSSQQTSFRLPGEGSLASAQKQRRSSTGAMAIGAASRNLKSPTPRHSLSGTPTTRRVGFAALSSQQGRQEAPRKRDWTKPIRAADAAPARADEANWRARPTDTASQPSTASSQAEPVYSALRGRAATSFLSSNSSNSPISRAKVLQARSVRIASESTTASVSEALSESRNPLSKAATAAGGDVAAPPALLDIITDSSTAASSAAPAASTSDPIRSGHNDSRAEADSANFASPRSPSSRLQAGSLPQSSGAAVPAAKELESSDAARTNAEENPYEDIDCPPNPYEDIDEDMDGQIRYGNFITGKKRGRVTITRWADMCDEEEGVGSSVGEEDTSFTSCNWAPTFETFVLDDNMSYPSASDAPYHGHAQARRRYQGAESEEDGN